MTPLQRATAIDYVLGRAPYVALRDAGVDPAGDPWFAPRALREAKDSRDADSFECALLLAFHCELITPELAPLLADLLEEPWHQKHEDLAQTLQDLRDPATADALARAALAKHDYLEYDDGRALARKCTWALADIGTPLARAHLERLARDEEPKIAAYAQKRLDHWDDELSRKGPRPPRLG